MSSHSNTTVARQAVAGSQQREKTLRGHSDSGHGEADSLFDPKSNAHTLPWYSRKRLRHFTSQEKFHNTIIGLVIFDLLIVFIELIIAILSSCTPKLAEKDDGVSISATESEHADATTVIVAAAGTCVPTLPENAALADGKIFLFSLSVAILFIFTIEIAVNIYAKGFRAWARSAVSVIDAIIVICSLIMELAFKFTGLEESGVGGAIVVLRVWKIVRAMHAVAHSIEMRNQHLIHTIRHAMRSTTTLTAEVVTVYAAQRKQFSRLQGRLLEAVRANDISAIPEITTGMNQVFDVVDEQLNKMKKTVEEVQEEEVSELLEALDVSRDELDEDSDAEKEKADIKAEAKAEMKELQSVTVHQGDEKIEKQ